MPNTAPRLITLIMLLQRQPNQKAADLAARLGVSVRTLHRYMGMLDELGIPIYSERGPYGGFSLVRGYRMPPLIFTPEEATALALGAGLVEETWGRLYAEAAQGALAKLDNVLPDEQRREVAWARRTLVATGLHRAALGGLAPLLEHLRRALREGTRVRLAYRGANQAAAQERPVDPYALVHRWGWWYLVGYCHLREALRTFRVDRILGIEATGQRFTVPAGFDVQAYLAGELQRQPLVRARLRFAPQTADVARSAGAAWEALEEQPDGSLIVTLAVPDLLWAASTALSFGPAITVLEPAELRSMVAEWAAAVAAGYAQDAGEPPPLDLEHANPDQC